MTQRDSRNAATTAKKTTPPSAVAPSELTYTDIDGDKVKITASAGDLTGHATIVGGQLRLLISAIPRSMVRALRSR
jgi:hypothetical protein